MPTDLPARSGVHSLGSAIEGLRHKWGWIVAFGVFLDLAGVIALGSLLFVTVIGVVFVGALMTLAGIAELVMGFRARDWGHFLLWVLGGALYLAAGIFTITNPFLAALVLTLFL